MTELSEPMERALQLARDAASRWIRHLDWTRDWNPAYQTVEALVARALVEAQYFPPAGERRDPNAYPPVRNPQPGDTVLWYRFMRTP